MAAILNFRFFLPKMQKHKFTSVSLTMRDGVISSKFSTHRVSQQTTLCNFQKKFLSSKMAAILNFCQKSKNTNLLLSPLTVRDRAISSKFSIHRVSQQSALANFQKIFLSLKMEAILNFSPKMEKHKLASISLIPCEIEGFRRNFRPPGCPEFTGDFSQKSLSRHFWRPS